MTRLLAGARLEGVPALTATQTAAVIRHLQLPDWPIDQLTDLHGRPWMSTPPGSPVMTSGLSLP